MNLYAITYDTGNDADYEIFSDLDAATRQGESWSTTVGLVRIFAFDAALTPDHDEWERGEWSFWDLTPDQMTEVARIGEQIRKVEISFRCVGDEESADTIVALLAQLDDLPEVSVKVDGVVALARPR